MSIVNFWIGHANAMATSDLVENLRFHNHDLSGACYIRIDNDIKSPNARRGVSPRLISDLSVEVCEERRGALR